jgi:predicted DNA-binding protein with PD1-like motif
MPGGAKEMSVATSTKSRHLVVRIPMGERLPGALLVALREHGVACGWVRASGVLDDIELRGSIGTPTRHIAGRAHAVTIEGSVGLTAGDVTVGLRAVLVHPSAEGAETLAGEITSARVIGLEAIVTALDDVATARMLDAEADVWLMGDVIPLAPPPPARREWNDAVSASSDADRAPPPARRTPAVAPQVIGAAMPQRLVRAPVVVEDSPSFIAPEVGDVVEHFAFGACEVIKSDGERLHLKLDRDSRVKEISLEMLRVTPLPSDGPNRRFKLDRKL